MDASYLAAAVFVRFLYFVLLVQVSCYFSSMLIDLLVFTWPTILIVFPYIWHCYQESTGEFAASFFL
jgi:hypothetical protein